MDVEKYIYIPTTHGNYLIVRAIMEPILDTYTNQVDFRIKDYQKFYRALKGRALRARYKATECFDTKADAMLYADAQINVVRNKMVTKLKSYIASYEAKITRIMNSKAKLRYRDLAK